MFSWGYLYKTGSTTLRTVCALHLFTSQLFELSQTEGASMLPTLSVQNDFCIIDKRFRNGRGIEMGDIIVARKPTDPNHWVCKRITGMPGDVILIDPSSESVNRLREHYQTGPMSDSMREELNNIESKLRSGNLSGDPFNQYIIVPDGHVWVTGDNLSDSIDSRIYSALPMGLISGKIICGIYFPQLSFRWLNNLYKDLSSV